MAAEERQDDGNDGPASQTAMERSREEIERLRSDLGRERESHLRTRADFENFRRRVERDADRTSKQGRRDLIVALLDVIGDMDRALGHARGGGGDPVFEGVLAIRRQLENLLGAEGVVPYESVGQPFDPRLHEAVGVVESATEPAGAVLDEVSRGYRWGDEVLRPARVLVSQ